MMEIRILGAGSGMPDKDLHSSSVLVQSEGKTFLLDCGDGCSYSLTKLDLDPDALDAVIITHYHPDHVAGVFLLIQMLYLAGREKVLPIYLPEREQDFGDVLKMFYTFSEKFNFELRLKPMTSLTEDYPQMRYALNDHLQGYGEIIAKHALKNRQCAFSIRINSKAGDFVYSSDISSTDSIADFVEGAHTLLLDAGHPVAEQVWKMADRGLKRILLTHRPNEQIRQALAQKPDNQFEEAREGSIYRI